MLLVLTQQAVTPPAVAVLERLGVEGLGVGVGPVVDALPGYAEHPGNVGGRAPVVELQDGEGAPQDAGVGGLDELTPEAPSLPGGQDKSAHALLLRLRSFP